MKRFLLYIIALLCALTACKKDKPEIEPLVDKQLRRLVVVYMTAENTLSGFATNDLAEIRMATKSIPSDCALAVYFDNANRLESPSILLFDSIHGERTMLTLTTDPISSDSAAMQSTLSYITQEIKAKEYALVLWGHGSGWLPAKVRRRAYGPDNGNNNVSDYGTWMEIPTLRNVLKNIGIQWRYIFHDVCFMQCVELAYELRHVTDWNIASPAEIPGEGAPYNTLMPYFFQAQDFARDIPGHYNEAYSNNPRGGVLISSIRSEALEQLAEATRTCIDTLSALPVGHVQQYGYAPSNSHFYDIASLMGQWLSPEHYAQWTQSMEQAIPYRYQAARWESVFGGLDNTLWDTRHYAAASMYVPQDVTSHLYHAWQGTQWAQDVFAK